MTMKQRRLKRLLDVRQVRLRIVARELAEATRTAASTADIMTRIGELSTDMTIAAGSVAGYEAKAAAATRTALAAAGAQQATRVTAAEAKRIRVAGDLRHQRAAIDVVTRAVERGIGLSTDMGR